MLDSELVKIVAEKAGPGALIACVALYLMWRMASSHARATHSMVQSNQDAVEAMARSFEERMQETHRAHEARMAKVIENYERISTQATAALALFNEKFDRLEVRQ